MVCASTALRSDGRTVCRCPGKSGCVRPHITTRKPQAEQHLELSTTELFGDLAYPTPQIISHLKEQQTRLIAPQKKPKGKELTNNEKYYNRLVRRIR